MIPNQGLNRMKDLICGADTNALTYITVGTGGTTANTYTMTDLTAQVGQYGIDSIVPAGAVITITHLVNTMQANGNLIDEVGVECADNQMFGRRTFAGIVKNNLKEIRFTWTFTMKDK